jgi:glycosyltransferase involved in cell wall biosynthesis
MLRRLLGRAPSGYDSEVRQVGYDGEMESLMFSLIIPTYNRAPILRRMLQHLFTLEGIAECEVIVVNDGSTDGTTDVLEEYRLRFPGVLRTCQTTNGGQARARNHGIRVAQRDHILFIDDDVFPREGMLQSQKRMLDGGYTGSQGILHWHPEITITPLIRYLNSRGTQFAFDQVKDPAKLSFAHVYTANFAVSKKAVVDIGGFDERFFDKAMAFSAFEDTILGYTLQQNGAELGLNRDAVADHLHDMTEEAVFRREQKVGFFVGRLKARYPSIAQSLGYGRRGGFLNRMQAPVLGAINRSGFLRHVFGYSFSLRLSHREAFCRGLSQFERELAKTPGCARA